MKWTKTLVDRYGSIRSGAVYTCVTPARVFRISSSYDRWTLKELGYALDKQDGERLFFKHLYQAKAWVASQYDEEGKKR